MFARGRVARIDAMMTAIMQDRYGAPDVLRVAQTPRPVPGPGEVLVRVHAASVNARDWHVLRGDPYIARLAAPQYFGRKGPKQPIRGTDFAGVVEAVGASVIDFQVGDEVFGEAEAAFAEYVTATLIAHKPANLSFAEAAALPLAAITALMGVREVAAVRPGQRVLVNGASGGVGLFAVQLAKADGAHVTAVCSARNADLARQSGAEHVIDYAREDFCREGRRYDVVLDLVANRSLRDLRRALAPTGILVLSGGGVWTGGSLVGPMGLIIKAGLMSRFARQRIVQLTAAPSAQRLQTVAELAEAGTVRPMIDRTYPLAQAAEAIRYVAIDHARAKVVLTVC
jgi:NADPH:quinone reductase-like Zn-dependent oxidoreductase